MPILRTGGTGEHSVLSTQVCCENNTALVEIKLVHKKERLFHSRPPVSNPGRSGEPPLMRETSAQLKQPRCSFGFLISRPPPPFLHCMDKPTCVPVWVRTSAYMCVHVYTYMCVHMHGKLMNACVYHMCGYMCVPRWGIHVALSLLCVAPSSCSFHSLQRTQWLAVNQTHSPWLPSSSSLCKYTLCPWRSTGDTPCKMTLEWLIFQQPATPVRPPSCCSKLAKTWSHGGRWGARQI